MQAADRLEPTPDQPAEDQAPEAAPKAEGKERKAPAKQKQQPKAHGKAEGQGEVKGEVKGQAKARPEAEETAEAAGRPHGEAKPRAEGKPQAQAKDKAKAKGKGKPAPEEGPKEDLTGYTPRLREKYLKEVVPALQKDLSLANVMQVPKIVKVTVNIGMGEALTNPKAMESAERDITAITGQKPVITKAKKSIATFKIRKGMPIGIMVTLRGNLMYEFLDRLFNIALPRIRDFRGVPVKGFDGRGNYSLGIKEHVIFPEIDYNSIDRIRGFQVTMVTSATTDDQARRLLALMGLAFAHDQQDQKVAAA